MKNLIFILLKAGLRILYAPMKLFKSKNRIVYLSRQSNEKSVDMCLLEQAIKKENPNIQQVFRLKMIDDGISAKIKYCFSVIGDMYYLATSKAAIIDTYSITVSCLKHKDSLKVIQIWHALGAIKKFGLQSVGTKTGRDEKVSKIMCMHKNYDFVIAPSPATAQFYMEAFGVESDKIKICPMPRVDYILEKSDRINEFYSLNPSYGDKKLVLYLPTFRDKEAVYAQMLKTAFDDIEDCKLIISAHPLSKAKHSEEFAPRGNFSTYELMKFADVIITDYSACAFEASLLMKPLYFYVPDYDDYCHDRGINVDIRSEMGSAVFDDADKLTESIVNGEYDMTQLYAFKKKYIQDTNSNNAQILAKFIIKVIGE